MVETEAPEAVAITKVPPAGSSLFLGPTMAEDINILEHYFTSNAVSSEAAATPHNAVLSSPGHPVVYLTIPKRRGLNSTIDPGSTQREILEQILGPAKDELVRLYGDFALCFANDS